MAQVTEISTTTPEELLAAGRRHLAVRDYSTAAETLSKACELLAQDHGDVADECAEAYLLYGKALLGLSREESGVIGDGVLGSNNEEGDDNEEENCENGDNVEAEEKVETEKEEADSAETQKEETKEVQKNEAESTTKEEEPGSSTSNEEKPGSNGEGHDESVVNLDEDDADNLQLAWEMLDLSRNILQKRAEGGTDTRSLLAEVHLALGEVALESETYDKAVLDMVSCLDIQKALYKSDDRRIAETHYQIGLANSLASNFEDAITHFKNAANILETRIKTLENPKTVTEDATVKKYATTDPFYSVEGEIKELKELLPEIQEKIQDMMDYKAETIKRVRETLCGSTNGDASNGASSSKPEPKASNISHLIKRKRKNSDEGGSASKRTIKRVRETLCGSTNGDASNGASSSKPEPKASNISHLIKRKRKNSDEGGSASKRVNT